MHLKTTPILFLFLIVISLSLGIMIVGATNDTSGSVEVILHGTSTDGIVEVLAFIAEISLVTKGFAIVAVALGLCAFVLTVKKRKMLSRSDEIEEYGI